MFELDKARDIILMHLLSRVPVDTGALRAFFLDNGLVSGIDFSEANMLINPLIYYGFILNNSPTIRRALRKEGYVYKYKVTYNKHFRFMDNFFEGEAITIFEKEMGVERIW